jgi:hypothetical protein
MNFIKNIIKKVSEKGIEIGMVPTHRHSFTKHRTKLKKNKRKNDGNTNN